MGNPIQYRSTPSGKPAQWVLSDRNWLESSAIDQLITTTELPGICAGFGMPDLHPGKGQPIGAAFVSDGAIYPHLVGSDIGCGMGLWALDIDRKRTKIDKWEKKLTGLDDPLAADDFEHCDPLIDQHAVIDNYVEKIGTIGGGNHFAEFQQVHQVFDAEALNRFQLCERSVCLLVHSGSRGLGQMILRGHVDIRGANPLIAGTADADAYLAKHDQANAWAEVNRAVIAWRFQRALGIQGERILDASHNHVEPLSDDEERMLNLASGKHWIHRKGANPTNRGAVMIPGSRGSLSYLVQPVSDNAAVSGYSLAHGAGRKWKRSDVRGRLEKRFDHKSVLSTRYNSRVICANRDLAFEEAPQAYKNIDWVIDDMASAGLITLIASFKPVMTYKTRKK